MSKFTKAPWAIDYYGGHYIIYSGDPDTDVTIASGMTPDDAALIAAAPDMYEALDAILTYADVIMAISDKLYENARAALRKAEGKV